MENPALSASEQKKYYSYALILAVSTILISAAEAGFSVYFGLADESLTLFGFGMDSLIEIISGIGVASMVLRIRRNHGISRNSFEKTALKITGFSFFFLVAALLLTIAYNLLTAHKPETTLSGLVISVASILFMLALLLGKKSVGEKLGSKAILSDAECTRICIYMSLVLLVSSGIYALIKIPFIDEAGTLALAWFSFKEGKECFEKTRHDTFCSCGHEQGSIPLNLGQD